LARGLAASREIAPTAARMIGNVRMLLLLLHGATRRFQPIQRNNRGKFWCSSWYCDRIFLWAIVTPPMYICLASRTVGSGDSMSMARELKRKVRAGVAPLLFLSVTAYFGWNATQGDLGLQAYAKRQHDLQAAQANLAHAEAEMKSWEQLVRSLRSNHLDTDALDERVRAMLNRADPADIVVPYGPNNRLF
jgi:cell division protein FtsB